MGTLIDKLKKNNHKKNLEWLIIILIVKNKSCKLLNIDHPYQ